MASDVLASDIGDELLIAVAISVENEADLLFLLTGSKSLCREEHSEFKWHVEPGQMICFVKFRPGEIMQAEATVSNDIENFLEANFSGIVGF
jgi:hypothetical protein